MDINEVFVDNINPDSISVYIGRVIALDENFSENGYLYVDLVNPDSKDLTEGRKTSNRATATFALRNCYNSWERPPEIKSKTRFYGSMNMTTSGDFHLRNYCFDVQTLTWFSTVSAFLNSFGIINIPPVMVSLDTTPIPGQAVSVNVSLAATEVVEEAIDNTMRDLQPSTSSEGTRSIRIKPSLERVKQLLNQRNQTRGVNRSNNDPNTLIAEVVTKIMNAIGSIADKAFKPYYDFIKCISLLCEIYKSNLDDIEEITWPITQFTNLTDSTTNESPNSVTTLALKKSLAQKIDDFISAVENLPSVDLSFIQDKITESVYEPLNYMYTLVSDSVDNLISPIKNKIVQTITMSVKEPLSKLVGFIAMAIQPVVSALPTIVQFVVKKALEKLLRYILGKPIEFILGKVIDPIIEIIEGAADSLKDKVYDIFENSILLAINPLISVIQNSVMKMLPTFDMGALKSKLESIRDNPSSFPDIYIGLDPLKPYKKFIELNWSDSNEVACMLHTLLEDLPIPDDLTPTTIELKSIVEEIDVLPSNSPVTRSRDVGKVYTKKFTSKDEFLPYFTAVYPPVMIEARLGEGMFAKFGYGEGKKEPDVWITNGLTYVTTDDGERYIVALENGIQVNVYYPDVYEIGVVTLVKDKVYYTEEVPHIHIEEDDPDSGTDLIPRVILDAGELTPEILFVQKTNEEGELVYQTSTSEGTYEELVCNLIEPQKESVKVETGLEEDIQNLINAINTNSGPNLIDKVYWLNSNFGLIDQSYYITLTTSSNYNEKINIYFLNEGEDPKTKIEPTAFSFSIEPVYGTPQYLKIIISCGIPLFKYELILTRPSNTGDFILDSFLIYRKIGDSWYLPDNPPEGYPNPCLTSNITREFYDPNVLYVKVKQKDGVSDEVTAENLSDVDTVNNNLLSMFLHTIMAIGQNEGFEAEELLDNAIMRKPMSVFNILSESTEGVSKTVDTFLEGVDSLKKLDTLIDSIQEVGDKINEVAETAKPALEATAKAASAAAFQSCSMSQAAQGKDFGFSSGENYDLSTTRDARLQLPYCKQLNREHLLEPNCKVLVLAVGAGKQNLYVLDILT